MGNKTKLTEDAADIAYRYWPSRRTVRGVASGLAFGTFKRHS